MRLAFKIPSYILGVILVIILAAFYVYYFTTLPESELNNWIGSLISAEEDLTISVGRINRDIWDHLMFEQVFLQPAEASPAPAVYISKMELDYDFLPLIKSKSEYRSLVIDSVAVEFPAVSEYRADTTAGEWEFRLPLNASIGRVFINLIDINLSNGEKIRLDGLAFSASAKNEVLNIVLSTVSGHWRARDIDIYSLAGNFSYSSNGIAVNNMHIVTNRSAISLTGQTGRNITDNIKLNFDCNPIDLTDIRNLTGVKLSGILKANGTIRGSLRSFGGEVLVNGLFFDRDIEDLRLEYGYSDRAIDFNSINGYVFNALFRGRGRLDFSTRPERFSYSGRVDNLDLIDIGPDLQTDFTGNVEMTGSGLAESSFSMGIDCDLNSVRIEDYYFDDVSGPFRFNLSDLEFLDGFNARYKNTYLSFAGLLEYIGEINIRGKADFRDLTDFTGQIFLKKLGGRGNADYHVTGPTRDFNIEASFYSDSCWTYGLEPSQLFVEADLKSFISHRVGTVDGSWRGGELYSVPIDSGSFRTSVSGDRVFVDSVRVDARDGELSFAGNFDGTVIPPVFTVDTLVGEVYGNGLHSVEPLVFSLYDKETEFSRFKLLYGSGSAELGGIVTTDLEMDLELYADGFQIHPILEQIYADRDIDGILSGTIGIGGDFANPTMNASVVIDSLVVDNTYIGNFDANADYSLGYLKIQEGQLRTTQGSYDFSGKLPMNLTFEEVENRFPNDPIDLRLTANGNRIVLSEVFIPTIESFVTEFNLDMSFTGSYEKPLITGDGELKAGELKALELEIPLTDVAAKIRMENETIFIIDATASVSVEETDVDRFLKDIISKIDTKDRKPLVRASGTMKLLGLGDFLYDIDVEGENFYFRSDQYDITGISDFDLQIQGPTPPTVSGDIIITRLDMREEFDSFYDPEYEVADAAIEDSSLWNLDLNITGQNNLWIKNSEVDAEFKTDVHVERNVGLLVILGTLEVNRGSYYLVGQRFRLESGLMTYQDVAGIDPEIDFIVSTRLRGREGEASVTEVELNITGTLFEPRINTTAASTLSREDVLRLILERNWATSGGTRNLVENADALVKALGVDPRSAQGIFEEIEFRAGEGEEEKATVSIAKYISPDLNVRYSQRLSGDNPGRLIGVEYYLKNHWIFKVSQGQQSSDYEGISFDINYNVEF
jgi:hypothetical protein